MKHENWIKTALADRERAGLLRRAEVRAPGALRTAESTALNLDFTTNDYLGLAKHPQIVARAQAYAETFGTGGTASRLVGGTLPCHVELEAELANHKGYPAALIFGSGFLTNLGLLGSLAGRGDTIVADRLAHASLLDGARSNGATLKRFRHNDPEHAATLLAQADGRSVLVTESVFSMDGDRAPLADLAQVANDAGALFVVDEAHATGVFGPNGAGLVAAAGLQSSVNASMGTLSKGLGGYGGFVACSAPLREWLVNHARAFIYTTSLPPAVMGAALGALEVCAAEPERAQHVNVLADRFREGLRREGFDYGQSDSPIVPVMMGDNHAALSCAARLKQQGIQVVAIRPPTVPEGTARLRFSLSASHTEAAIETAISALVATRSQGVT